MSTPCDFNRKGFFLAKGADADKGSEGGGERGDTLTEELQTSIHVQKASLGTRFIGCFQTYRNAALTLPVALLWEEEEETWLKAIWKGHLERL